MREVTIQAQPDPRTTSSAHGTMQELQQGDEEMTEGKPLSKKHEKFINEYLKCWNGTRAYMRVYPKAAYDSARANASELLANPNIAAVVTERMNEAHMSADEALEILAAQARGDVAKLMDISTVGGNIDLHTAQEQGLTRLIKKFKQKTTTIIGKKETDDDKEIHEIELELYDAQAAAEKILKIHGKFVDRQDITSGGEKIEVPVIYIPSTGRD